MLKATQFSMQRLKASNMSKIEKLLGRGGGRDGLPLYHSSNGGNGRRTFSKQLVHFIPIIVISSFFILWFFSSPVDLEVKNGRFTVVAKADKPIPLSETRVDLTLLAATAASPTYPYASISHAQKVNNQTAAEPASGTD